MLINRSLPEVALLKISTVITSLHLLRLQLALSVASTVPKGCREASAALQAERVQSLFEQMCTASYQLPLSADFLPLRETPGSWSGNLISLWWRDQLSCTLIFCTTTDFTLYVTSLTNGVVVFLAFLQPHVQTNFITKRCQFPSFISALFSSTNS